MWKKCFSKPQTLVLISVNLRYLTSCEKLPLVQVKWQFRSQVAETVKSDADIYNHVKWHKDKQAIFQAKRQFFWKYLRKIWCAGGPPTEVPLPCCIHHAVTRHCPYILEATKQAVRLEWTSLGTFAWKTPLKRKAFQVHPPQKSRGLRRASWGSHRPWLGHLEEGVWQDTDSRNIPEDGSIGVSGWTHTTVSQQLHRV